MKAVSLTVPRSSGEELRRRLADAGLLRSDLRIVARDETITFPIVDGGIVPPSWGALGAHDFEPRPPEPPSDYRALLAWPAADLDRLPRSFDVVGDIVVVRIPADLEARATEIGAALRSFVPGARVVGWDRGVHGTERVRRLERIAGSGGWATYHRENGLRLAVDLERAYFSPRLAREHALVADEVQPGDRVYDLCCGVGPFAAHIARDGRAREIVAVDSNPAAIDLLRTTLAEAGVGARVTPVVARIEEFVSAREPFERAVLNLPLEGIKYASSVARLVVPGGRLYYYEVVRRAELDPRGNVIASSLPPTSSWRVVGTRSVHPYSPDSDLAAYVLERSGG